MWNFLSRFGNGGSRGGASPLPVNHARRRSDLEGQHLEVQASASSLIMMDAADRFSPAGLMEVQNSAASAILVRPHGFGSNFHGVPVGAAAARNMRISANDQLEERSSAPSMPEAGKRWSAGSTPGQSQPPLAPTAGPQQHYAPMQPRQQPGLQPPPRHLGPQGPPPGARPGGPAVVPPPQAHPQAEIARVSTSSAYNSTGGESNNSTNAALTGSTTAGAAAQSPMGARPPPPPQQQQAPGPAPGPGAQQQGPKNLAPPPRPMQLVQIQAPDFPNGDGVVMLRRGPTNAAKQQQQQQAAKQLANDHGVQINGIFAPAAQPQQQVGQGAQGAPPTALAKGLSDAMASMPQRPVIVPVNEMHFLQQIGEGGFGKVYYGHWRGAPVAIKVANVKAGQESTLVKEFQREVLTMCSVPPHEHTLRLCAASTSLPTLALVTEYCARGSLYQCLHAPGARDMRIDEVLRTCLGIAQGMAHLHAHRVLHRDLKSANVLIDDRGRAKIADFGLAKLYSPCASQVMTGGLGTYQWMAPEVLAHQRYSEKADVYGFAIVVWECLARKLPYSTMTAVQAAVGVVATGLRPELPSRTPPELATLIKQCWAAVPDQRPSFPEVCFRLSAMLDAIKGQQSTLLGPQSQLLPQTPVALTMRN